jgi:hypothetical protein
MAMFFSPRCASRFGRYYSLIIQNAQEKRKSETCNQVFDRVIAHCELRVGKGDMAPRVWRDHRSSVPTRDREEPFEQVLCSQLAETVAGNRTAVISLIHPNPSRR